MILVLTSGAGAHVAPLLDALARRRAEVAVVDPARLARSGALSARWSGGAPDVRVATAAGEVRLAGVRAASWAHPRPVELGDDLAEEARAWAAAQWEDALAGIWDDLSVRWVNHPARGAAAERKVPQLRAAAEAGLRVPRTLVTSDPAAARAFVEELGGPERVVHKTLRTLDDRWRETRRVAADGLARLDDLRHAPLVFQEHVPGTDVRATVVGDEVLAAEIDAAVSAYADDWRVDPLTARFARTTVPDAVAAALRALLRRFGLEYGAFDLRRTPDGEHAFLEVNPFGRWLFVEERTGLPITDAIAAHLAAA